MTTPPDTPRAFGSPRGMRLLFSALVTLLSCGPLAAQQDVPQAPAVTVVEAKMEEFRHRVSVTGSVAAREEVLVYPEVSGYAIVALEADVDDEVEKSEVLARLNATVLGQRLAQQDSALARARTQVKSAETQIAANEARLDQADATLERTRSLRESGTATQSTLDEAIAAQAAAQATLDASRDAVDTAKAQVREAQVARDLAALDLERAVIKAPVGGIVTERNAKIGAVVASTGDPLFRILRDGEVDIEADVIETEIGQVAPGDAVSLDIAGMPPVTGTVRRIDPTIDPATRLGTVLISPRDSEGLRPGLFASGWITTEVRDGLSVPSTAVQDDDGTDYVFTVEQDGTLTRRDVRTGLIWQSRREILDGLSEGDVVVARAGGFFSPGDVIRPVRPDESAPAETE